MPADADTESFADLIAARFGRAEEAGNEAPAEGAAALLLRHRSRRRFTDRPVPVEELRLVLAAGLSAPAKSDLQQCAVVRAERDQKARVAELIPAMAWIDTAPEFLLFCGDGRRIRRVCEARGTPFLHEATDAFMNAAVDAALVMAWTIAAAEDRGMGCCPISAVRDPIDEIAHRWICDGTADRINAW